MPDGEQGRLVICPTPLGNLGDMTARALDALRAADVVCAEDTRVTGRLLAAFRIEKRLERLDEATLADRAARIVERVLAGETVVYCSDAGMPGVSDPGLRLVRAAREAQAPWRCAGPHGGRDGVRGQRVRGPALLFRRLLPAQCRRAPGAP